MKQKFTSRARKLRKNSTDEERILWSRLRNNQLGVKFKRQKPIGNYIVDFICIEKKVIIEVDGGQHCENQYDIQRDKWLRFQGYIVLRFWNFEVRRNLKGVLEKIWENIHHDD